MISANSHGYSYENQSKRKLISHAYRYKGIEDSLSLINLWGAFHIPPLNSIICISNAWCNMCKGYVYF